MTETLHGIPLVVYRGLKQIARFLDMHPSSVKRQIKRGHLPVNRDLSGRWVMTNLDYLRTLGQGDNDGQPDA